MKKLIYIFLMLLLSVAVYSKPYETYGIVIDVTTFSSDTVIYEYDGKAFNAEEATLIKGEIEYGTLNADDATFSFGLSDRSNTFNAAGAQFPYTLDVTNTEITINSSRHVTAETKASFMFSIVDKPSTAFAVKVTKGSVTSGKIYLTIKLYK